MISSFRSVRGSRGDPTPVLARLKGEETASRSRQWAA